MLFNCGLSLVDNGVLSTWYHRMPFAKTYHYEKILFLMYLHNWQIVKMQNYPDIQQHVVCLLMSLCFWCHHYVAFLYQYSSRELAKARAGTVLKRHSHHKIVKGFKWPPRSFPAFPLPLSSCHEGCGSTASVVWHTEKWCVRGASPLPCPHMGEVLWNRKLSSAFLGLKLVLRSWAVAPVPCKEVAFRNGLGFTCAFFFYLGRE